MVTFAARCHIDQCHIDRGMRLRHRLTAGLAQQHRPAGDRQLSTGGFEVVQAAHAPRHDQGMVGRAPEQYTVIVLAAANGGQQVLFGVQALFNGQGQGLIGH
ncbi:hypothetical protein D3C81_1725300 [compost metagenome]